MLQDRFGRDPSQEVSHLIWPSSASAPNSHSLDQICQICQICSKTLRVDLRTSWLRVILEPSFKQLSLEMEEKHNCPRTTPADLFFFETMGSFPGKIIRVGP